LFAGVTIDGSRRTADRDVESSLTAAVRVSRIGCISVDIEDGAFVRGVASAEGGSSIEVREDAEEFQVARRCWMGRATSEMDDFLADVMAGFEEIEKAAKDATVFGRVVGASISRSIEESGVTRSGDGRKVGSSEVREKAAEIAFLSDGNTAVGITSDGVASVRGAVLVKSERAVARGESCHELDTEWLMSTEDDAVVNMHRDSTGEGRVGGMEFDIDAGVSLGREEAGGRKNVGKVGVEDVVGLFEAIESAEGFHPLAGEGMRNITGELDDNLAWAVFRSEKVVEEGAFDIEGREGEFVATAGLGRRGMVASDEGHLGVLSSGGSEGVDIGGGRLFVATSGHSAADCVGDGVFAMELGLAEHLTAEADGIGFDVFEFDRAHTTVGGQELGHFLLNSRAGKVGVEDESAFCRHLFSGGGWWNAEFPSFGGRGGHEEGQAAVGLELEVDSGRDSTEGGVCGEGLVIAAVGDGKAG
jgi:hypothetical protein